MGSTCGTRPPNDPVSLITGTESIRDWIDKAPTPAVRSRRKKLVFATLYGKSDRALRRAMCPRLEEMPYKKETKKFVHLRIREDHWDTMTETLEMDSRSSAFDSSLRRSITKALESVDRMDPNGERVVVLNDRELGHVLAGLRMLDSFRQSVPLFISEIQTEAGPAMTRGETDALCERLNLGTRKEKKRGR